MEKTGDVIEKTKLIWDEIKASLQLHKTIFSTWYNMDKHSEGHFSDYLKSQSYIALRARKEAELLLWDSSSLINHCNYNDVLNVSFHIPCDRGEDAAIMNVEALSGNNGFILRKSKERYDLSYYFSLLHSHAISGELLVSPCFYFIENPNVTLSPEAKASISELIKINPIRLRIKKNQVLCFDKFHYQMEYKPDFSFVKLEL